MQLFTQRAGLGLTRVCEYAVGFAAIVLAYLLFLLLFDHSKFFEIVILFFELTN